MINLKDVPDATLVRELRGRGFNVSQETVDTMIRLVPGDVERIKGEATWSELMMQFYSLVREQGDLEAVHKIGKTPGGKPTKVAMTVGPTKLLRDLQNRWGTRRSETVRAFLYLVESVQQSAPEGT